MQDHKIVISEPSGFLFQSHLDNSFYISQNKNSKYCDQSGSWDMCFGFFNNQLDMKKTMIQSLVQHFEEDTPEEKEEELNDAVQQIDSLYVFTKIKNERAVIK